MAGYLNYILKFRETEINVTALVGKDPVTYTLLNLSSGTRYVFTLFTVSENVRSSGVNLTAVTGKLIRPHHEPGQHYTEILFF